MPSCFDFLAGRSSEAGEAQDDGQIQSTHIYSQAEKLTFLLTKDTPHASGTPPWEAISQSGKIRRDILSGGRWFNFVRNVSAPLVRKCSVRKPGLVIRIRFVSIWDLGVPWAKKGGGSALRRWVWGLFGQQGDKCVPRVSFFFL